MQAAAKGGYKHFMLKEIMEQPRVITDCLTGRVMEGATARFPCTFRSSTTFPCPRVCTLWPAARRTTRVLWGQQLLENVGGIPTDLDIASEFRYRDPFCCRGKR